MYIYGYSRILFFRCRCTEPFSILLPLRGAFIDFDPLRGAFLILSR